jgi:hypothetical protein
LNCHGSELIIKLAALKLGAKELEMEEASGELVACEEKLSVSSDVWYAGDPLKLWFQSCNCTEEN